MSDLDQDHLGYPIAEKPHPDAYFDPNYRSRHGPAPMDGWRFAIRCSEQCSPDCYGSIPATRDPKSIHGEECPDCGGSIEIYNPEHDQ